jgi:hypothetical protein
LPCDAREVSWAIAEKSLVNEVALMDGAAADVVAVAPGAAVVVVDVLDLELLHAAKPAVTTTAVVRTLARFTGNLIVPPGSWFHAPSLDVSGGDPPAHVEIRCRRRSRYGNGCEQGVEVRRQSVNEL